MKTLPVKINTHFNIKKSVNFANTIWAGGFSLVKVFEIAKYNHRYKTLNLM